MSAANRKALAAPDPDPKSIYDFDPENIQEGIYQVTFSTEGRELKVHTTDYVEEGQEVGLTFEVEDIHARKIIP